MPSSGHLIVNKAGYLAPNMSYTTRETTGIPCDVTDASAVRAADAEGLVSVMAGDAFRATTGASAHRRGDGSGDMNVQIHIYLTIWL